MDANIAARSKNGGCLTWWDGIMDVEAPCETFESLNACEAAYDGTNQKQHQNHGLDLLAGQDITWDCSLPWQDVPYSSSFCSASNLSPPSILSGSCPDWQSWQPGLEPLLPQLSHQAFFCSDSDELWQSSQWPLWPPLKGNQTRCDNGFGKMIWPILPDFNIDQPYFEDLNYLNYTGHEAGFPQIPATNSGPDSVIELPVPPVTNTGVIWSTVMEVTGGQSASQTIQQQPQQQLPVATAPHHDYAPEPASILSPSPYAATSELLETRAPNLAGSSPCRPSSPRQPAFSASSTLAPQHQQQYDLQQQGTMSPIVGDSPACLPDLRPSRRSPANRSDLVSPAYQVAPFHKSPLLRLSTPSQPEPTSRLVHSDEESSTHGATTVLPSPMCPLQFVDESVSPGPNLGVALDNILVAGSEAVEAIDVEKSPPGLQPRIFIDLTIDPEEAPPRKKCRRRRNSFTADNLGDRPKRHKYSATSVEAERGTQRVRYTLDSLTVRGNSSPFSWDSCIGEWKSKEGCSLSKEMELESLECVSIREGYDYYAVRLERSNGGWKGWDMWQRTVTLSGSEVERGLQRTE